MRPSVHRVRCGCSVILSRVRLFATPWTAAHQTSLSLTISWSLPNFTSIGLVMPSSHLILCHPLLLLPAIFPIVHVHKSWPQSSKTPQHHNPSQCFVRLQAQRVMTQVDLILWKTLKKCWCLGHTSAWHMQILTYYFMKVLLFTWSYTYYAYERVHVYVLGQVIFLDCGYKCKSFDLYHTE